VTIHVCPLSRLGDVVAAHRPSHLVTLLDPGHEIPTPGGIEANLHLRLGVHDIARLVEGYTPPDEALVTRLVAFGRGWDRARPLVIHCWAGVSRSSASAFVLACEKNPHVDEADIARELRRVSPIAWPNRLIVALADDLLGRGGRMVDAVDLIGPGRADCENEPFELRSAW